MVIKKGEPILILRYSDKIKSNCVAEHQKVIEQKGFVWWGKCGAKTSRKNIDLILSSKNPKMILYSGKNKCYICSLCTVTYEHPKSSYPKYYDSVFDEEIYPTTFYQIKDINEISKSKLVNLIISSSGRDLLDLMTNSMTTQCIAEPKNDLEIKIGDV